MTQATVRPDLIARRYDGLPTGKDFIYSFETQSTIPVDASNALARELSPFTFRLIPPALPDADDVDVNLIGRANQSAEAGLAAANAVRSMFGVASVTGSQAAAVQLTALQRVVSAGQVISGATSSTERAVLTDQYTAASVAYQLERILQTPPLTLLINPSEISINYSKVQNLTDRTREGFVHQAWGEGQVTLSLSGSTGGYYAGSPSLAGNPTATQSSYATGLQFASRRDSAAWQNFQALMHFYKNNGYMYDLITGSNASLAVGAVAIDFDQWTYVGRIDSLSYGFTEDSPHRMKWSLDFVASEVYDNASATYSVAPMTYGKSSSTGSPSNLDAGGSAAVELGTIPLELLI